ncbi:hypothetical protein BT96DRAFT_950349 [Gymnopus androsaceus JB14]|uniref:Uncharacterized protein n=1 Tax=Gymnopus androsaceus JB14 TaxID=1447944 RepID=A0A6A4GGJ4_9AGAR|nr:hypothetical protein BT96DRAFT_950349 [Gymnopus androsaceus JB14]
MYSREDVRMEWGPRRIARGEHLFIVISLQWFKNKMLWYAFAINRHFHKANLHQVIISAPPEVKSDDKDYHLDLDAYTVMPSFDGNGKPPKPNPKELRPAWKKFKMTFPLEVRKQLSGVQVGVMRWPKYYSVCGVVYWNYISIYVNLLKLLVLVK